MRCKTIIYSIGTIVVCLQNEHNKNGNAVFSYFTILGFVSEVEAGINVLQFWHLLKITYDSLKNSFAIQKSF